MRKRRVALGLMVSAAGWAVLGYAALRWADRQIAAAAGEPL